jgi:Tat protein secretion system quality control protein TatD with DNase activity
MSGAARVLLVAAVVQQGASWGVLPRPACPWGRPALRPAMAAATRCCAAGASGAAPGAGGLGGGIPEHCWDAHNHLQLSRKDAEVRELVEAHQMTVSLMGTQPADWAHARALAQQLPRQIRPSYGLHPWWAHEHPPPAPGSGWMHALQTALEEDPRACLGEIGLDGQWVPPGLEAVQYEQQVAAFREQLQLAVLLRRPVSVHCVKAYGDMFDTLRTSAELPPAVYMHSWGGKLGMLQSYVKMKKFGDRFYFGFSAMANLRDTCRKTSAVIAAVPDDRLLLESDLEEPGHVVGALERMLQVIAEAKGWSVEEAAAITQQNAKVRRPVLTAPPAPYLSPALPPLLL